MIDLDAELAERYGSYASYSTSADPVLIDTFGDDPAGEVDRLLNVFATPESHVLDLGCGAGQTLCRLAPQVKAIWGFDQDENLLAAARKRAEQITTTNATLILGNVTVPADVAQLPDHTFDVVLSRRGPNVNEAVMASLKPNAVLIQELHRDPLGLKEMLGRQPFLPQVGTDPHHWLIHTYRWLNLLPISVKDYFYEAHFRDIAHLAKYLRREATLGHWRMPDFPYDENQDQAALELYAQYNKTPQGIRLVMHCTIYLFRRTLVQHFPARPDAQPLY